MSEDEPKPPDPDVQMQLVSGDDTEMEPAEHSVEVSLVDYGAEVDTDDRETRLDRPQASEFGVDDRVEVRCSDTAETRQRQLVNDPEQRSLDDLEVDDE